MDACRELQKKLKTLQEEKQHPAPPTVSLQPENTAGALQQSFDEENRRRILSSRTPETAMRLGGAVLLGAVSVLLALELFGNRELLIDSASIAALGETGSSGKMMLLVAHILVSLAVLCGVGRRRADGKRHVLLTAVVAVGYLFMIGLLHAWAYAALIAVCGNSACRSSNGKCSPMGRSSPRDGDSWMTICAGWKGWTRSARRIKTSRRWSCLSG